MRKVSAQYSRIISLAAILLFSLNMLVIAPVHLHDDHQEHSDCSICLSAVHQHAESPDFSQQLIIYYCITVIALLILQHLSTISILSVRCRAPPVRI